MGVGRVSVRVAGSVDHRSWTRAPPPPIEDVIDTGESLLKLANNDKAREHVWDALNFVDEIPENFTKL